MHIRHIYKGNDELKDADIKKISDIEEKFHKAINDDMNMPLAMSFVWEAARFEKKNPKVAELLQKFDTVLGIEINKIQERKNEEISEEITNLLEQRKIAREQKEWSKSDEIRDLIKEKRIYCKRHKKWPRTKKNIKLCINTNKR